MLYLKLPECYFDGICDIIDLLKQSYSFEFV